MAGLAHVVTVDPTGSIGRLVRAALELSGQVVIQIDVRSADDALDEMQRTGCQLLVTALRLSDQRHGVDLAAAVKEAYADAAVIVLGDADDPAELDDEVHSLAAFTYLRRSVDGVQFMRAVAAGLGLPDRGVDGGERAPSYAPRPLLTDLDLGPIPPLDMKVAEKIIDALLIDVGAMAIVVATRAGVVLLERGAVGYLDREQLTAALLPTVKSTVQMGQLIGGQPAALQFYDGEQYDVFVLSIGFHHFMCLVFDGQAGSRQFGAVNRFGRRAAEDLVALLGIFAFTITPHGAPEAQVDAFEPEPDAEAPAEPLIERAEAWVESEAEPLPELEPIRLEPLEELDLNLFDDRLIADLDAAAADDLFDPDKLAEIANETRRERGPLSYDEARELGIIP